MNDKNFIEELRQKREEYGVTQTRLALQLEGEKRGFKRSYRASLDRIESISIKVPDINKQKNADVQISTIEKEITEVKSKIELLESKRMALINDSLL